MIDINKKIEGIVEGVISAWLWIIGFLLLAVLLITAPVWLVPYLIIRKIKRARE